MERETFLKELQEVASELDLKLVSFCLWWLFTYHDIKGYEIPELTLTPIKSVHLRWGSYWCEVFMQDWQVVIQVPHKLITRNYLARDCQAIPFRYYLKKVIGYF